MDIDQVTSTIRPLAVIPSRRSILRGLAGLAVGTALEPFVAPPASYAGRKKRKGKKKRPKKGLHFCANGRRKCGGSCVDITTDKGHCGGCDITCGDRESCSGGTCVPIPPTCTDGIRNGNETDVDCGGSCPDQCMDGKACGDDPDCQSGHCVSAVCRECATAAHCGLNRDCDAGSCCTVDGFAGTSDCVSDDECCSGNCVSYQQGAFRTCRPAGCVPPGGSCAGGSTTCCSWTCSGATCS